MSKYYIHDLSPIAFNLFGYDFHWYWLFYLLGFIFVFYGGLWLIRSGQTAISEINFSRSIALAWICLFLGARLIYVVVYHPDFFIKNPHMIYKVWAGGMSFHGAVLGIVVGLLFAKKLFAVSLLKVTDIISIFAPLGLFFGRIGNFINGELAGRITDVSWAVIFPRLYDYHPRHPSQIYQAVFEGLLLFLFQFYSRKKISESGTLSFQFLIGYGVARFCIEFFRMPDQQLGLYLNLFSMGQILCLIMILCGFFGLKYRKPLLSL